MTNPLQEARMARIFDAYDADGDRHLTRDDFTHHIDTLEAQRGRSGEGLRASIEGWWEQILANADTDGDGRVTRDEFVVWACGLADALRHAVDTGEDWPLNSWIDELFGVIDGDGDGRITLEEYRGWCTATRLAESMDVDDVFAAIDGDGDGILSRDEFSSLSRQYWLEFDPALPGHRWIGP